MRLYRETPLGRALRAMEKLLSREHSLRLRAEERVRWCIVEMLICGLLSIALVLGSLHLMTRIGR